jgi:hypothetical protein
VRGECFSNLQCARLLIPTCAQPDDVLSYGSALMSTAQITKPMRERFSRPFAICLIVAVSTIITAAQTKKPSPRDDAQVWSETQFVLPIHKHIDFLMGGLLRLGRDVTHTVQERASAGFTFKISKYFTAGSSYSFIASQPLPDHHEIENRLSFDGTVRLPVRGWTVSDRNMIERRFREPENSSRYRNRLQIEHPIRTGEVKLRLFASDEVFYDWAVASWVRNRFSVGAGKQFAAKLSLDFYYMRQNDSHSHPGDLNVFGTLIKIKL